MSTGVRIGQAAAFVGVTIKTVRHYHRLGLVDEPRRDGSGYRRYGSSDLLRLIQVRTLAESGVPLSEISGLLGADLQRFAVELAGIKRRLTERIEELTARRDVLDRLANGDRALLPDKACALLDRAADLGFTPDAVVAYREGMVLVKALVPDGFDDYFTDAEHALDDTRFVELVKKCWAANWSPTTPTSSNLRLPWPTASSPTPRCSRSRTTSRPAPTPPDTGCSTTTAKTHRPWRG
jgi:DNA-binding transcriptional MerR regulator